MAATNTFSSTGVLVKRHRHALGLSQTTLAEKIGRTQEYVSHIESGLYLPSDRDARLLADALLIPVSDVGSRGA